MTNDQASNNSPIYYVDQPAELLLGPTVCRISFGVNRNDESDFPHPVIEIAIPTSSLISLVSDLRHAFDGEKFKSDAKESLRRLLDKIDAGTDVGPSATMEASVKKTSKKKQKN